MEFIAEDVDFFKRVFLLIVERGSNNIFRADDVFLDGKPAVEFKRQLLKIRENEWIKLNENHIKSQNSQGNTLSTYEIEITEIGRINACRFFPKEDYPELWEKES